MKKWESFTNQNQWKEYLQNLLKTNDAALIRAILLIYEKQTPEEKQIKETKEENKVGFSGCDAYFMSSLACQIRAGYALTDKQMAIARNKMPRYWKQLMQISKKKMKKAETDRQRQPDFIDYLLEDNVIQLKINLEKFV